MDGLIKIKEQCGRTLFCGTMTNAQILKNAGAAPRYSSYPTAPHFHEGIDGACYGKWLAALPAGSRLSLYVRTICASFCTYFTTGSGRHSTAV